MNIRGDQKLQVQQATDIVRLIGEEVSLRPRGREFVGLCPFHDDQNPSFNVSPVKQIYKCFSCGAGGDVFSFVMNYHKMTFPEALGHLAQRAGIALEPIGGGRGNDRKADDRQMIANANEQAKSFFQKLLAHDQHGAEVRAYIQQRGVSDEMVQAFGIGYAPDRWDGLVMQVENKGYSRKGFELAGLITARSGGQGWYDRFRHRLMFPICDALGRPIAFGARRLREDDDPKYLNSPETALFNKSATLYGLHLAKKPIIDSRLAVVVEGYTDVIACHQSGVGNVVATLGTALTQGHARALSRLCDRVVLIFDADEAGQKAADRAVEVFLNGELDVAVAVLPDGQDPAGLLALDGGVDQLRRLIDQAVDALTFKLDRMEKELADSGTLSGRQRITQQYLRQLVDMGLLQQSAMRRAMVVGRVAAVLGVNQRAVESELNSMSKRPAAGAGRRAVGHGENAAEADNESGVEKIESEVALDLSVHKIRALQLAEQHVIGCLLRRPALFHQTLSDGMTLDEALTPGEMVTSMAKTLYLRIYDRLAQGEGLTLAGLLGDLASNQEQGLANLATDTEAQVEACCGDDEESLTATLITHAESILRHHREQAYQRQRRSLFEAGVGGDGGTVDTASLAKQLIEDRRDHPSAVRIAKIERGL